jgi:N-acetylglucosaminyldiphosphoundecaprenol N-acetyl-beta-D-mannosaminyltransferase
MTATVDVAGIPFHVSTPDAATRWLVDVASARVGVSVRLANAYCVALAADDAVYSELLRSPGGVNFPDGTPVVWFMRLAGMRRGGSSPRRIRGPSFFVDSLAALAGTDLTSFFLGASPDTLHDLKARCVARHPTLRIAGSYSPPFGPLDETFLDDCVERVRASGADVVWVGLGTPKQDYVAAEVSRRLGIPSAGVGAAFDFVAGSVAEAPKFIQNSGLEWAYRLMTEPRRLWRRYLFGNARFLRAASRGLRAARRARTAA